MCIALLAYSVGGTEAIPTENAVPLAHIARSVAILCRFMHSLIPVGFAITACCGSHGASPAAQSLSAVEESAVRAFRTHPSDNGLPSGHSASLRGRIPQYLWNGLEHRPPAPP